MIRRAQPYWVALLIFATLASGCRPAQPFHFLDDHDLSHYLDKATEIDYPDTETTSLADVEEAMDPLTLDNDKPNQIWELTLEECVKITLANSKVMRQLGGRFSSISFNPRAQVNDPADVLSTNPNAAATVYDPAIVETTPFSGVESALAPFDPTLSTSVSALHNDHPQNFVSNGVFAPILVQDQQTFQTTLSKVTASGGTLSLRNNTIHDDSNQTARQIPADWITNEELSFSQPLLQGAGAQFNRIAGPQNPFTGVGTAQFDGVMLARINTDITLAQFEAGVRNLVGDVENAYWELNFAYRALEAAKTGRDSALQTWRTIHTKFIEGANEGDAAKEAQAKEQYFLFRGQAQQALNDLFRIENRLRFVMGLAHSDGRLIRPCDEPTTAKVNFDWTEVHCEALARSVELRQQKWRIKERELELIAARNFLLPRLDVNGTYRFFGQGEKLIDDNRGPRINNQGTLVGTNAAGILTNGQFQEYNLGINFTMPLGFRKELSQVRHYELQLARERARLQDQELEVSHQMGDAVRNIAYQYNLAQTNFNRRIAAEKQVEAVQFAYDYGKLTLDQVLDAQRRRADAEVAYYRALADYNRAIMQVHLRKGSLLEYNGVYLAEGPWPAKAYFDAERLAKQRDASFYLDYGFTRPRVISQGAYEQQAGGQDGTQATGGIPTEAIPAGPRVAPPLPQPEPESLPVPPSAPSGPSRSAQQPRRSVAAAQGRTARGTQAAGSSGRQLGTVRQDALLDPAAYESITQDR